MAFFSKLFSLPKKIIGGAVSASLGLVSGLLGGVEGPTPTAAPVAPGEDPEARRQQQLAAEEAQRDAARAGVGQTILGGGILAEEELRERRARRTTGSVSSAFGL